MRRFLIFVALTAVTTIAVELFGSSFLYYRHRKGIPELKGYSSSVIIYTIQKISDRFNASNERNKVEINVEPSPLFVPDKSEGYVIRPGSYRFTLYKQDYPSSKPYSYKATILSDGSRNVGGSRIPQSSDTQHVFVYGDSFVFGEGVNDEQTFSYLLQQKYPDKHVRLHAIGGAR